MSRAYRISIKESVSRSTNVEDKFCFILQILAILPRESMASILEAELKGLGFEECEEEGLWTKEEEGVVVIVDPKTFEVRVEAKEALEIELEEQGEAWGDEDYGDADTTTARARLVRRLEGKADAVEQAKQKELTERLEKALPDIRKALERVANKVMSEGLKQKAATLGEIQDIDENEETGELSIRIKV